MKIAISAVTIIIGIYVTAFLAGMVLHATVHTWHGLPDYMVTVAANFLFFGWLVYRINRP